MNELCINLSSRDVGMVEYLGKGVDFCAGCKLESSESIAETMKGDSLGDACRFQPFLKRCLSHEAVETLEHKTFFLVHRKAQAFPDGGDPSTPSVFPVIY